MARGDAGLQALHGFLRAPGAGDAIGQERRLRPFRLRPGGFCQEASSALLDAPHGFMFVVVGSTRRPRWRSLSTARARWNEMPTAYGRPPGPPGIGTHENAKNFGINLL